MQNQATLAEMMPSVAPHQHDVQEQSAAFRSAQVRVSGLQSLTEGPLTLSESGA